MGDEITRAGIPDELTRAKFLREALQQKAPGLSRSDEPPPPALQKSSPTFAPDNPDLQRAYLEQIVECAPEAISILDLDYRITRLNSEFTNIFGFRPEEALGKRIESLIVPPDRSSETRWITDLVVKGKKVELETKRQRKDGVLLDVFISTAPIVIAGEHVANCVLYRDISEQKRAEALNSALYRIAQQASLAADMQEFYKSIHGIVGEFMPARNFYIAVYDPAAELLSFPYFEDEEDPRPASKKLGKGLTERVLTTGKPLLCTPDVFKSLVKQGDVELIGAPSLDWLGVPLKTGNQTFGVVVVQSYAGNIRFGETEKEILTFVSQQLASAMDHKRNEAALRRSEARHRSLVQSAVYGIYRCSLDGRFLDANPALITMLGYDSAERVLALDPKCDLFLDAGEQERLTREFQRGGRLDNFEVRWKRKDGSSLTARLSGRAVDRPEEAAGVWEIFAEDVTERRVLENQFRQAQKMEAVGRLAGGVAHDFNNLLMVISGYTEVLLEQTGKTNPLYPKIEAIYQATDRATTLTRQLLAFSRKQLLELKVVDVNVIVQDMERLLHPLIGENIKLQTTLSADLGKSRADAGQIEQVIMNLVVNAKDAMPQGGKITIQTSNATLNTEGSRGEHSYIHPGQYVLISVSDTGQGMDKETQSRVFEPFFTTKEKGKGTGLGLSTVYGIVKQSGGYVLVESELKKGSTFRIYLPRVEESAEPAGPARIPRSHAGGTETVLLAEDEASVRQLVRETLESKGYKVLEAASGEAALEIVATHSGEIDMLITDVVMPGISGRELSARLSATHPQTKVLYLSGYTEDSIVHEGVLDPGTAFLQKPFTLQMLSRKVREVLGNTRS
jgi:two-component system cell cycle sensor histidine kinase/response regulator CckA